MQQSRQLPIILCRYLSFEFPQSARPSPRKTDNVYEKAQRSAKQATSTNAATTKKGRIVVLSPSTMECSEPGKFGGGFMRGVPLMRDHSNCHCNRAASSAGGGYRPDARGRPAANAVL